MRRFLFGCILIAAIVCIVFTFGCGGHANSQPESTHSASAALRASRADSPVASAQTPETPSGSSSSDDSATSDEPPTEGFDQGLTQHHVYLSWNRSPSDDVVGYNIYRGPSAAGPFQRLNKYVEPATVYTDNAVVAGKIYFYVITAVTGNAESRHSTAVSATIPTT